MNRSSSYYRKMRFKHIRRKKRICHEIMGSDWYTVDGRYSKGKIHCSCMMCTYDKRMHLPTVKEKQAKERLDDAEKDYFET